MIENVDQRSKDYAEVARAYRPGHADYAYDAKYGIRDPRGGDPDRLALVISDGTCTVVPGPALDPGAIATVGAADLVLLASGGAGWPALLSAGRLELSGDPFLGLRFPKLFGLPVAVA